MILQVPSGFGCPNQRNCFWVHKKLSVNSIRRPDSADYSKDVQSVIDPFTMLIFKLDSVWKPILLRAHFVPTAFTMFSMAFLVFTQYSVSLMRIFLLFYFRALVKRVQELFLWLQLFLSSNENHCTGTEEVETTPIMNLGSSFIRHRFPLSISRHTPWDEDETIHTLRMWRRAPGDAGWGAGWLGLIGEDGLLAKGVQWLRWLTPKVAERMLSQGGVRGDFSG